MNDPQPLDRATRAQLVDRVVLECARDPRFAHLLANNLAAAGVELPASELRPGRKSDWSHAQLVSLAMDFAVRRREGATALAAQEAIAETYGRGLSAASVGNMLSRARREVDPEDLGPKLRKLVFPNHTETGDE